MSEAVTLSRDALGPIEIKRHGTGWRTPEIYANVRKLGLHPSVAHSAISALLIPEMAARCKVPIEFVVMHAAQSWVDPNGRLVFWLEARTVDFTPTHDQPAIDLPPGERHVPQLQHRANLEIDRQ